MAGNQQARIVDTIVELKRAFTRHNDDSDGEDPIDKSTNRGNKLMQHAKYTQEGRLNNGASQYRRKIEHAGYEREIIYRNPRRYDEDGDLIVIDEPEDEADLSPAEDNIYGRVRLEETLMPLTAAQDLPNHPSLSAPYNSKYLDEMIANISETLRREQENLVKMKKLLTSLRGDADFVPCGAMEAEYDALLAKGQGLGPVNALAVSAPSSVADVQSLTNGSISLEALTNGMFVPSSTNGAGATAPGIAVLDAAVHGALPVAEADGATLSTSTSRDGIPGGPAQAVPAPEADTKPNTTVNTDVAMMNGEAEDASAHPIEGDEEGEQPAHRMTTRAQANKPSTDTFFDAASVADSVPPVHPYFTFPPSAIGDTFAGLPQKEAEEARGYLAHYVAKQEEVVLNLKQLEAGLLEAHRKRKLVVKWCKAEGHVGEMSDGEDWYDEEEWGLDAPLKKGMEEVDEDIAMAGKKTRRGRERAAN